MPGYGVERDRQLGWQGVFRRAPDSKLHLVVPRHDFVMPNGLCFSPDEKLLYINDSEAGLIRLSTRWQRTARCGAAGSSPRG